MQQNKQTTPQIVPIVCPAGSHVSLKPYRFTGNGSHGNFFLPSRTVIVRFDRMLLVLALCCCSAIGSWTDLDRHTHHILLRVPVQVRQQSDKALARNRNIQSKAG